jgi:hypothetical protein
MTLKDTSSYIGKKVKILDYRCITMIGKIGIIKSIGIYPNTTCNVKVGDEILKFRGLKHLKIIDKIIDENTLCKAQITKNNKILEEILEILIELRNMNK